MYKIRQSILSLKNNFLEDESIDVDQKFNASSLRHNRGLLKKVHFQIRVLSASWIERLEFSIRKHKRVYRRRFNRNIQVGVSAEKNPRRFSCLQMYYDQSVALGDSRAYVEYRTRVNSEIQFTLKVSILELTSIKRLKSLCLFLLFGVTFTKIHRYIFIA